MDRLCAQYNGRHKSSPNRRQRKLQARNETSLKVFYEAVGWGEPDYNGRAGGLSRLDQDLAEQATRIALIAYWVCMIQNKGG
jgi:hypothetical protein